MLFMYYKIKIVDAHWLILDLVHIECSSIVIQLNVLRLVVIKLIMTM